MQLPVLTPPEPTRPWCTECHRLRRLCGNHQPPLDGALAASNFPRALRAEREPAERGEETTTMKLEIAAPRPAPPLTVDAIRRAMEDSAALARLARRGFAVELVAGGRVVGKRIGKGAPRP